MSKALRSGFNERPAGGIRTVCIAAVALASLSAASASAADIDAGRTPYCYDSEPGDYIGGGVSKEYENATSIFTLSGNGRGCNQTTCTLTIDRLAVNGQGNVSVLGATFEQHCEGGAPALHRTIHHRD